MRMLHNLVGIVPLNSVRLLLHAFSTDAVELYGYRKIDLVYYVWSGNVEWRQTYTAPIGPLQAARIAPS